MSENLAKGKKGFLLYSPFTKKHFFRVYHPDKSFSDYRLAAEDIEIEIVDEFTVLKDGEGEEMGKLDYKNGVLGKK